ncbi:hypothetical protein L155662 [Lactococcus lactis subsp. lactis Il1403]|uniref:Acyl-ACP thioesterase N-terminal hotdog domain-containing protein n=1 Tax=Lactococcus lactis subsp. lactis (strain IL1403) TaxID=272623 RepID=Q9CGF4_LACLA|nr:hypothetical protein L155662 [Lactococcus lactis subsp. lactis Il1403]
MGIKYQQNYQVPFYESDAFKKMRISSLLAVALQISGEQSTALGRSDVWVFERYGLFWAVIEYELTIHRLPEFNEKITIETEATSYNKFFCYRNFSFLDENGEVLVEIRSTWVLMDKATRKLTVYWMKLLILMNLKKYQKFHVLINSVKLTNLVMLKKLFILSVFQH